MEKMIQSLYPHAVSEVLEGIEKRCSKYPLKRQGLGQRFSEKDAILITYGDSIQDQGRTPLTSLRSFLETYLGDALSAVHLLPCFPYTSDDGFSVVDYYQLDPNLGSWDDMERLNRSYDLMFDAVVNHISQRSDWFQGYLKGEEKYRDYFIEENSNTDYSKVVRPRALPLFHEFDKEGKSARIWTTFSKDQVDLNYRSPAVFLQVLDVLLYYVSKGARYIRLDAIAFIWKKENSSCIHLEEAHTVIRLYRKIIESVAPATVIITETNVPHMENISYFGDGTDEAHMVYNFTLPPLLALSVHQQKVEVLTQWATNLELPSNEVCFFNFTASHDGVGVRPLQGIVANEEIYALAAIAKRHGGFVSMKDNGDGTQSPYELNCNYLDLITDPQADAALRIQRFLLTQSVMLAFPGVPGVYYHSVLGSENDRDAALASGIHRRINRKKLMYSDLVEELTATGSFREQMFSRYKQLLQIRKDHLAFHPLGKARFYQEGSVFIIEREHADEKLYAVHNFSEEEVIMPARSPEVEDLIKDESIGSAQWQLPPFGFLWLKA